jgi:hypothetical protein
MSASLGETAIQNQSASRGVVVRSLVVFAVCVAVNNASSASFIRALARAAGETHIGAFIVHAIVMSVGE